MTLTRLKMGPVIERIQGLEGRVHRELGSHEGLKQTLQRLSDAAHTAERVTAAMRRPFSLHRLPVVFLAAALLALGGVLYWQFFRVSTLTLALPDRDAVDLRDRVLGDRRLSVKLVDVPGSREGAALVERGEVDLAFVQGGIPVERSLPRLEAPSRELVLYFVRPRVQRPGEVKKVLTSVAGEGSHSVAQAFFGAWQVEVAYVHDWPQLTKNADFVVPQEVDAVFVVKDAGDEQTLVGAERLRRQGFVLASPTLGARFSRFDWLRPATVPAAFLEVDPPVPSEPVATYSVTTWLVAREGLTPRRLAQAAEVLNGRSRTIDAHRFTFDSSEASELFQGVDAVLSILVNIGIAFLALLGLDLVAYRRHFHALNSLVSLIGMLQSNKDVLGTPPAEQRENLRYLAVCSDMLSIISAISGFYTQENSSLLHNNLSELVHQRCDGLKLNIQLKLLQAMVQVEPG